MLVPENGFPNRKCVATSPGHKTTCAYGCVCLDYRVFGVLIGGMDMLAVCVWTIDSLVY